MRYTAKYHYFLSTNELEIYVTKLKQKKGIKLYNIR